MSNPVKLLAFLLVLVAICFAMIFGFILPNIDENENLINENSAQVAKYNKIKQDYDLKFKEFEAAKSKDSLILSAYETKFDKDKFISFATKYFSAVNLTELDTKNDGEKFFRYQLNITTSLKTPQNFYDFLDALVGYESIIKVEFPIQLKGDNDQIYMMFNIRVYGLR